MSKEKKICPFSLASSRDDLEKCLEEKCQLWEPFKGMCTLAVQGFLAGRESALKEKINI